MEMTSPSTTDITERRRVAAIYDRLAPAYDRMEGVVERTLMGRSLRAALGAAARGSTLEVAIGTGRNLPYYGQGVTRIVGVDLGEGQERGGAQFGADFVHALHLVGNEGAVEDRPVVGVGDRAQGADDGSADKATGVAAARLLRAPEILAMKERS